MASTLTLTSLQPFQSGQYAVLVTNAAGWITSFPASLGVSGPGTLTPTAPKLSAAFSDGRLQLSFQTDVGRIYSWLVSTNLTSWSVLSQFVSGGSLAQVSVPRSSAVPIQYDRVSSP